MAAKFALGQVVSTPGAIKALAAEARKELPEGMKEASEHALSYSLVTKLLNRHVNGDWGDLEEEDRASNDAALTGDDRIFSSYQVTPSLKIWIITEADRSSSCILLPSEY